MGFNRSVGPVFLVLGLVAAGSVAGFSAAHRAAAIKAAVVLAASFLFEGAYRAWREERLIANDVEGRMRELQNDRYSDLYRQCNAVNGALIAAGHVRNGAVGQREPSQINALAEAIDTWIARTAAELESVGLECGSFRADTGDYGSGIHGGDDVLEIKDAMLRRQLERLDRHVERLRTLHDRLTMARESSVRVLYGERQ
jgi:hypothetical protein